MTKEEILNNQALGQHMLFFSPLNKHAVFEKTGIHYEDQKPGVRILDYGKAEFNFPAAEAKTVSRSLMSRRCCAWVTIRLVSPRMAAQTLR